MKLFTRFLLAVVAFAIMTVTNVHAQFTGLSYKSDPGTYVLGDNSYTSTGTIGTYGLGTPGQLVVSQAAHLTPNSYHMQLHFNVDNGSHLWTLGLTAPYLEGFTTGIYDTTRVGNDCNGIMGALFVGDGRGYSMITGAINVLEYSLTPDGFLDKLAINYSQYGDRSGGKLEYIEVRYNSSFGFTSSSISAVPEPSTYAAIVGAIALAITIYMKRP